MDMTASRSRLPNRRHAETLNFHLDGQSYVATVGFFQSGGVAEVFVNTAMRQGSASDVNVADAALAVSLALQYGCPLEALRDGMKRDSKGTPQGPLGAILDILSQQREEEEKKSAD